MKTAVVILNWNTREHLKRWLPSLLRGTTADIWVADNASSDGSASMLAKEFEKVRLISLNKNYGFTGGYNRAMDIVLKSGDYKYAVLLNSDVEVSPGWLEPLEEWLDSHPECGICGPKLLAMTRDFGRTRRFEYAGAAGGCIDRMGYSFCRGRVLGRTEDDEGQYDSPADVFWISGACLVTRTCLWQGLGGLDSRFFAHMEEIDYCWRAHLDGWKATLVPSSEVWHLGGGTLPQNSPFKLKLNFRNNLLLLDDNLEETFASEGLRCPRLRAETRIRARRFLDLCSAMIYLLCGKTENFKAVLQAHAEFKKLKKEKATERLRFPCPSRGQSAAKDGFMNIFLLPLALLTGKRIFQKLRQYENRYLRSR